MLSEDVPIGWTSIIVDRLDTVEITCKDVTHIIRVLIGLTSSSDLLNCKWGIYDVEDCQQAATALAVSADTPIDGKRVAIRGGSAGAYTTLSSVTFAPDPAYYKTACGAYGCVADPETLTKATEKFESQYIFTLFGSRPDNHAWDPRNPIKHVSKLSVPLLVRGTYTSL
jgi:dipeptidyl aminopeptidase/acylaminoacyl peptidase